MKVGELWVQLGIHKHGTWNQTTGWLSGLKTAALGLAGYFGAKGLGKSLIGFNATVEEGKNQIAGMLALSRKTDLTDELGNAEQLYKNLQKRAASLPGTTEDYIRSAGNMAQPIIGAGLSLKELEDMTVATVVAAKGLGITQVAAARDVEQAIRGQLNVRDQLTTRLLKNLGIEDAADRKRFNAMSMRKRAEMVRDALAQKQVKQLGEAYGKSFTGQVDKASDAVRRFLGRVGQSLFKRLSGQLGSFNEWFAANEEAIMQTADRIGETIADAFDVVKDVVLWLIDHKDAVIEFFEIIATIIGGAMLMNTIKFMAKWGPFLLFAEALVKIFEALQDEIGTVGALIGTAFAGVGLAKFAGMLDTIENTLFGIQSGAGAAAGGIGGLVNQLGLLAGVLAILKGLEAIKDMRKTGDPTAGLDLFDATVPGAELFGLTDDARAAVSEAKTKRQNDFAQRMVAAKHGNIKEAFGEGATRNLGRDATQFDADSFFQQIAISQQVRAGTAADIVEALKQRPASKSTQNTITLYVKDASTASEVVNKLMSEDDLRHTISASGAQ